MAILIGRETRVICQGLTGRAATFHVSRMLSYGTRIVGGVTPGKGGSWHLDLPVFDTVAEAVAATRANASLVFVPPDRAAGAMIEAIQAGVGLVVCVTERVPLLDMVRVRQALNGSRTCLVGPNSQGVLAPGVAQLGVMATASARRGGIGIASRSASLTSEIVAQVTRAGLGQSTTVGVGGDPVHGLTLAQCVELFEADSQTEGIILIGEIGGSDEEDAAETIARLRLKKPVVALVAGRHAPRLRRMGHAGAFTSERAGSADRKIGALRAAGVLIAPNAHNVGLLMREALTPAPQGA
ncbi:MAG: succinate--CoA ligase subunit alpha [Hyphomicrobiaceae bacterium]|nr:succinate--CoA ligase subunit alpha [Hyphomicrobiaceae bacterium]